MSTMTERAVNLNRLTARMRRRDESSLLHRRREVGKLE